MHFLTKAVIYLFFFSSKIPSLPVLADDFDDSAAERELSNIQKLKTKLLDGYDSNVRPVMHHSNTTSVFFNLIPLYIVNLIEELTLFQIDSWLFLSWHDYRLAWNASDYGGIDHLQIQDHLIWQPDIKVYNGHSGNIDPKVNTHLLLFNGGHIVFVPPAVLDTHCPIELQGKYPDDTITCKMTFGSWAHDGWQIDLQIDNEKMYMDEFQNSNPRWELLIEEATIERVVNYYNCCEEPYVSVTANFPMKRKPPQELQVVWAPCILVMALTLMMFWIHPSSSKKILLSGFLFLILCILMTYVASVTKSPTSIKRAVTFLESTLYALTSAIIVEIIVMNLCQITGPCRPPDLIMQLLLSPRASYFLIWPSWKTNIESDKVQLREDDNQSINRHPTPKEEWTLVAVALDRIFFFIYIIVFSAIHQI